MSPAIKYETLSLTRYSALVSYYNDFVIALNEFIRQESGKQIRIWVSTKSNSCLTPQSLTLLKQGTFPPKDNYTNNIPKDVAIQHWAQFEDNPYFDYM